MQRQAPGRARVGCSAGVVASTIAARVARSPGRASSRLAFRLYRRRGRLLLLARTRHARGALPCDRERSSGGVCSPPSAAAEQQAERAAQRIAVRARSTPRPAAERAAAGLLFVAGVRLSGVPPADS